MIIQCDIAFLEY